MADEKDIFSNFSFLREHDPVFFELAYGAERSFSADPNTTLVKLRQLAEALTQDIAARCHLKFDQQTTQADLLFLISRELQLEPLILNLFHGLRKAGNVAVHQFRTRHKEALAGLKVARDLAVWFHRNFAKGAESFSPGPFITPKDPSAELTQLQDHIAQLKNQLLEANCQLEQNAELTGLLKREKAEYQQLAELMNAESRLLADQAKAHEAELKHQQQQFEHRLAELQTQLKNQTEEAATKQQTDIKQLSSKVKRVSKSITLDEESTRMLIDMQLIEAGWEADSILLDYRKGARPQKGKNLAIAEWPTQGGQRGRADYVLFVGLIPIAVVEAKRENINVAGAIPQAERYSKGFVFGSLPGPWLLEERNTPWSIDSDMFFIPFVYSCNGRPFVKQLAEQSGTWFRDVRSGANLARALQSFHSPDGLVDLLKRNRLDAEAKLKQEGFGYLKLRPYQQRAIEKVEIALEAEQRECLLAMATGTGKTRTIIGLMYRFLKTERFKRILFLVDRTALGEQAIDAFKEAKLEQNKTLSTIYNIAELGDMAAEAETRVQVATVQAMVKRIFASDEPPTVDEFDCIIVDEAHRGYTLDQDMTDGEIETRDATQYLSSYRRVLEYFDAVKIGLTATPAKHTSEIFGKPVYLYSYREAVAEDWLIDHEPPIRYETLLTQNGINFVKGETVTSIDMSTGTIESAELDDELNFDVNAFNKRVISENFNRVICKALVQELDPFGEEKTMIFCATDLHADMVKRILDEEFQALYNGDYNQAAVAKITGKSDKVTELIRRYKNERYPNIAITVDLLTTGIDVPKICHLVFMRRVKSRILYEQMIGRATRRCDDIGKTVFKIYDPVDIYAALAEVNTMKPLVKNPNITIEQLIDELTDETLLIKALQAPGDEAGESQADTVLSQLSQKLMRVLRKAENKAERYPALKQKLIELGNVWGVEPGKLHQHLHSIGPQQASQFLKQHGTLIAQLEQVQALIGSEYRPVISYHEDELTLREQAYGGRSRPEDYLSDFESYIRERINQHAALMTVVNRPKDLTREQLKEIRMLLDGAGYSETNLKTAWRGKTNHEIAAGIIGHIRRAALGEPLVSFDERVAKAMHKIYALHNWNPNQRKWLDRLAKQLVHEAIIDRETINQTPAFEGGAKRLNQILDDQLDTVLEELGEFLWEAV
ncbi:type I restriction-modification system endonuclease [Shewanella sp. FDAARGOS_354]|uniref:type I restriction-modification system endonuclease n=1 Tax=Shewanella sp. FDAARGOS_354 TaxID=1930557 RepID=UPI000B51979B|nr:type I restriction-modification system endonuclease [Shewanella sp. FDAARGOS_354]ASF16101.1 type I restriction-modification system endonuclease [Shewanella sp. FDAARGOS_354]